MLGYASPFSIGLRHLDGPRVAVGGLDPGQIRAQVLLAFYEQCFPHG